MESPIKGANLKKWPHGILRQHWGDNPHRYSAGKSELHTFLGGHTGIDIGAPLRAPVYAAHDGYAPAEMIADDPKRAGGREVWVYSDPLDGEEPGNSMVATVYCHLDEIAVKPNQRVVKGETILGYVGNTGFVVSGKTEYWGNAPANLGVHLHFGVYELIRKGSNWVRRYINVMNGSTDPLPYITESADNPHGDLSGMTIVLNNMLEYLNRRRL